MKKLFAVDLKRLLNNKAAIIIVIGAPLLLVLLISFAVAPFFFADVRTDNFRVAVYNEDDDPITIGILKGLIESESLGGLIEVLFVDSESEGIKAVEDGAAAYVHVPKNMQYVLYHGGNVDITYYGNPEMPLEDALMFETLNSGVELISHAQHAVNVLYFDSVDSGIDRETASSLYSRTTAEFFARVLSREDLYERTKETSPLGGALPIEYYAASFLILFVALGAMPIARITADDYSTGLIHRQLLSGNSPIVCFVSRWLAGSVFLFIQYTVLTIALCVITGAVSAFSGNVLMLLICGVLLCAFVSLGMMLVGLFSKSSAFAVGISFMSALALALVGGLLVPSAFMPAVIRDVSYFTPFSSALRLGISGMFEANSGIPLVFAAILLAYIVVLLPISIKRFQRRVK